MPPNAQSRVWRVRLSYAMASWFRQEPPHLRRARYLMSPFTCVLLWDQGKSAWEKGEGDALMRGDCRQVG